MPEYPQLRHRFACPARQSHQALDGRFATNGKLSVLKVVGDWQGQQTIATMTLHVAAVPGTHRVSLAGAQALRADGAMRMVNGSRVLEIAVAGQ